ncbi:MAG TPA: hypothetical protein VJH96_04330 [Patescibacteria group bacterium]|nr:hypothetical protein [Patescibacteria group bacterium]
MIFLADHEYTDLKGRIPSLHCLDITYVESRDNPYTHYISLDRAQLTGTSFKGECFLANCISMVTVNFWEPRKATHFILPLEVIQDSFHPEIQEDRSLEHYQNIQATGNTENSSVVVTLSSSQFS